MISKPMIPASSDVVQIEGVASALSRQMIDPNQVSAATLKKALRFQGIQGERMPESFARFRQLTDASNSRRVDTLVSYARLYLVQHYTRVLNARLGPELAHKQEKLTESILMYLAGKFPMLDIQMTLQMVKDLRNKWREQAQPFPLPGMELPGYGYDAVQID